MWQYFVTWLQLGRLEKLLNRTADALEAVAHPKNNDGVSFDLDLEVIVTPDADDDTPSVSTDQEDPLDVVPLTNELLWQLDHGKLDVAARQRIEQELMELNPDAWQEYLAVRWD
ncbi:MAG TPA: hypothetical protein P5307_19040 [Pirellulaceae bacterium]|nr:hypothetical protein [Pirellulaceae bacterium]